MKKLVGLVLVTVMLLSFSGGVFASFADIDNENILMFNTVIPETEFQDDFCTIFRTDSEEANDNNMEYEYYADKVEENWYEVVMKGDIIINETLNPFNASGEIQGHEGYGEEITLMGPLNGIVTIDGEEFNLIIGLNKKGEEEYLTTTIYNENLETVLVFGEVIDGFDNHIQEIRDSIEYETEDIFSDTDSNDSEFIDEIYTMYSNERYDYVKAIYGDLERTGQRGLRLTLYQSDYSTTSQILKLGVRSYNDSIESDMRRDNPYLTSVDLIEVKVGLNMGLGTVYGTSPSERYSGSGILRSILMDALGAKGVPTSVLDEIFSNMRGRVDVDEDMRRPSITITSGWAEEKIYCDYEEMPLFFGMETNKYDEAEGDFYGELEYKISSYYPSVGSTSFYRKCYAEFPFSVRF